jgi:hypothetical protein
LPGGECSRRMLPLKPGGVQPVVGTVVEQAEVTVVA